MIFVESFYLNLQTRYAPIMPYYVFKKYHHQSNGNFNVLETF